MPPQPRASTSSCPASLSRRLWCTRVRAIMPVTRLRCFSSADRDPIVRERVASCRVAEWRSGVGVGRGARAAPEPRTDRSPRVGLVRWHLERVISCERTPRPSLLWQRLPTFSTSPNHKMPNEIILPANCDACGQPLAERLMCATCKTTGYCVSRSCLPPSVRLADRLHTLCSPSLRRASASTGRCTSLAAARCLLDCAWPRLPTPLRSGPRPSASRRPPRPQSMVEW